MQTVVFYRGNLYNIIKEKRNWKMENQTELNTIWESLGISNDFMFSKIMQDVELCKEPDAGSGEYGKRYGKRENRRTCRRNY